MVSFVFVGFLLLLSVALALSSADRIDSSVAQGVYVKGNKLQDKNGNVVRLIGVDRSGTEFACIANTGFFDGPTDAQSLQTIATWGVNVLRVPLNEDCWLNINGVNPAYGGQNYITQIVDFVGRINAAGFAVIVDLHWAAPGTTPANKQLAMPDHDHAITFWQSVANTFKGNPSVIFDLYNEPFPDNGAFNSSAGWNCWRNGGWCNGFDYQAAGMQDLVSAVRAEGANNVVMLGGLAWSNSLGSWLQFRPTDPANQMAASWHSYNFNECSNKDCWDQTIAPLAKVVPVIAGEIGENDCSGNYITPLMTYLDSIGANYLGWTWNTWDCNSGPALITNYNGSPTGFGQAFKNHIASLKGNATLPLKESVLPRAENF